MFGVVVFTLGDIIALILAAIWFGVIALIVVGGILGKGILSLGEKILRRGLKEEEDDEDVRSGEGKTSV
jgi:hypothetical protein